MSTAPEPFDQEQEMFDKAEDYWAAGCYARALAQFARACMFGLKGDLFGKGLRPGAKHLRVMKMAIRDVVQNVLRNPGRTSPSGVATRIREFGRIAGAASLYVFMNRERSVEEGKSGAWRSLTRKRTESVLYDAMDPRAAAWVECWASKHSVRVSWKGPIAPDVIDGDAAVRHVICRLWQASLPRFDLKRVYSWIQNIAATAAEWAMWEHMRSYHGWRPPAEYWLWMDVREAQDGEEDYCRLRRVSDGLHEKYLAVYDELACEGDVPALEDLKEAGVPDLTQWKKPEEGRKGPISRERFAELLKDVVTEKRVEDVLARFKWERAGEFLEWDESSSGIGEEADGSTETAALEDRELVKLLEKIHFALAELVSEGLDRETFRLMWPIYAGLQSTRDLQEALDVKPATLRRRKFRALKEIRRLLPLRHPTLTMQEQIALLWIYRPRAERGKDGRKSKVNRPARWKEQVTSGTEKLLNSGRKMKGSAE